MKQPRFIAAVVSIQVRFHAAAAIVSNFSNVHCVGTIPAFTARGRGRLMRVLADGIAGACRLQSESTVQRASGSLMVLAKAPSALGDDGR